MSWAFAHSITCCSELSAAILVWRDLVPSGAQHQKCLAAVAQQLLDNKGTDGPL